MRERKQFSWMARGRSFVYAWRGVRLLLGGEHNAWIHLCAAAVAIALGVWLEVSRTEWLAIAICIGGVLAAEGFNTAIEALCDLVSPEPHPLIARAKDVAAGAVLLMAAAALACGAIIFLPKLISLL